MAKKSIVVEIMGKRLAPYGFQYEGYAHFRWNFIREMEDIKQEIVIQKDRYDDAYTLELSLNDIPESTCRMKQVTDDPEYRDDFLSYRTKEEQTMILNKLGDFVDKYGINRLNELIEWEKTRVKTPEPTVEMSKRLYEDHTKLTKQFIQRNQAEGLPEEEILQLVKTELLELRGKKYEDIQDELVELAAVYGDMFIKKLGGELRFLAGVKITMLSTPVSPAERLLDDTIRAWHEGQAEDFINYYNSLCARTIKWIKEMRSRYGDNWQKEHAFYKNIGYEIPLY